MSIPPSPGIIAQGFEWRIGYRNQELGNGIIKAGAYHLHNKTQHDGQDVQTEEKVNSENNGL